MNKLVSYLFISLFIFSQVGATEFLSKRQLQPMLSKIVVVKSKTRLEKLFLKKKIKTLFYFFLLRHVRVVQKLLFFFDRVSRQIIDEKIKFLRIDLDYEETKDLKNEYFVPALPMITFRKDGFMIYGEIKPSEDTFKNGMKNYYGQEYKKQ